MVHSETAGSVCELCVCVCVSFLRVAFVCGVCVVSSLRGRLCVCDN